MDIKECSEYTGICTKTLYKFCQERRIPFHQPGGKLIRFQQSDIDKWLDDSRVCGTKSMSQLDKPAKMMFTALGKGKTASEGGDNE